MEKKKYNSNTNLIIPLFHQTLKYCHLMKKKNFVIYPLKAAQVWYVAFYHERKEEDSIESCQA